MTTGKKIKLKKGDVFSSDELTKKFGNRMAISRLVQEDKLIPIGAGFYSMANVDPFVAQARVIAKYYPRAVISGISALLIHKLSDERTDKMFVDVPEDTRLRNRLFSTRRIARGRLIGIQSLNLQGQPIRIYNVERSLCDAYRIDRGALFFKALKRYMKQYPVNSDLIAEYDKVLRTKVLRALQQELADA